ncbi:MAG TPA: hypothetical protein VM096_17930 [Vicinamibacterales bacterium]|nr:hypothetical protein [Vicinamibacterales bacterium]
MLALAGDWIQHTFLPEPFLLLPINLTQFYLVPILACGMWWIANRARVAEPTAALAVVLSLVLTASRLAYWSSVARDLLADPGPGRYEALASQKPIAFWIVSAIGLAAMVALLSAAYRVWMFQPRTVRPGKAAYEERFPVGSRVRVSNRDALSRFRDEWLYHHPLQLEQLDHADSITTVRTVGFYHGGDPLYTLEGVPGTWHEACLLSAETEQGV